MTSPASDFHIYIDESSQSGHHYMVLGAIFCRRDAAQEIGAALSTILADHHQRPDKELHWSEIKGHTLNLYKDATSKLVGFTQKNRKMRYRALVIDTHKLDRRLSAGASRDDVLAKFIFTLVFGFARGFGTTIRYHVFIDKRQSTLAHLSNDERTFYALNNKAKSALSCEAGPFATVKFVDSKMSRLIQATDLITGAVAYETNGKQNAADASLHKVELWRHVLGQSRLKTLAAPTPRWPFHFQIAHFDFEKSHDIRNSE